ncbi:adenosylmethionine--8-amino-7-oxononanoate transaminase [Hirschia litorea]|uniref:Adenosylmethionine-8-amino-7-oxononanoate aminotransferase n=1 Tax=Hirschia litorea TaxID=1199156 RepID=A0ABW2ILL6_9PROT
MRSETSKLDWLDTGLDHIWLPYTQMQTNPKPAGVSHTQNATIFLEDGTQLVDGIGSWWTNVHGYNHPKLKEALIKQLDTMPHIMLGGLAHKAAYTLASRIAAITPGDLTRSFFVESGSVAVEVAMKVAVQYWMNTTGKTRTKFIAFNGGYHGDTFAAMSVCDPEEGMHSLFGPALNKQIILDVPTDQESRDALEDILASRNDIAAIMIEPLIQGAGGMRMHSAQALQFLREVCDKHNTLLIFDEIFTGFGRTGHMFAANGAGVTPDIMTMGKALTGGVTPLAATTVTTKVYSAFHDNDPNKALMHGPTFSGHALACAVAMASIDLLEEEGALARIKTIEAQFEKELRPLAARNDIKDVRILGAVAAVELVNGFDLAAIRQRFIDNGVFIRPLGNVMYLTPSYSTTPEELTTLTNAIIEMVDYVKSQA